MKTDRSPSAVRKMWMLAILVLAVAGTSLSLARNEDDDQDEPAKTLYVWTGDQARIAPDFLAVIDFDDAGFGWHLYDLAVALIGYQDHPDFAGGMQNALPVELVEPEDIANAAAWLCSDEARYITGVTLPVDAGFTVR